MLPSPEVAPFNPDPDDILPRPGPEVTPVPDPEVAPVFPDPTDAEFNAAIVQKDEGIEHAFYRQFRNNDELAEKYGWDSAGTDKERIAFSQRASHVLAQKSGYVSADGAEIRVRPPGEIAYVISGDEDNFAVREYQMDDNDGPIWRETHTNSKNNEFEAPPEEYEYTHKESGASQAAVEVTNAASGVDAGPEARAQELAEMSDSMIPEVNTKEIAESKFVLEKLGATKTRIGVGDNVGNLTFDQTSKILGKSGWKHQEIHGYHAWIKPGTESGSFDISLDGQAKADITVAVGDDGAEVITKIGNLDISSQQVYEDWYKAQGGSIADTENDLDADLIADKTPEGEVAAASSAVEIDWGSDTNKGQEWAQSQLAKEAGDISDSPPEGTGWKKVKISEDGAEVWGRRVGKKYDIQLTENRSATVEDVDGIFKVTSLELAMSKDPEAVRYAHTFTEDGGRSEVVTCSVVNNAGVKTDQRFAFAYTEENPVPDFSLRDGSFSVETGNDVTAAMVGGDMLPKGDWEFIASHVDAYNASSDVLAPEQQSVIQDAIREKLTENDVEITAQAEILKLVEVEKAVDAEVLLVEPGRANDLIGNYLRENPQLNIEDAEVISVEDQNIEFGILEGKRYFKDTRASGADGVFFRSISSTHKDVYVNEGGILKKALDTAGLDGERLYFLRDTSPKVVIDSQGDRFEFLDEHSYYKGDGDVKFARGVEGNYHVLSATEDGTGLEWRTPDVTPTHTIETQGITFYLNKDTETGKHVLVGQEIEGDSWTTKTDSDLIGVDFKRISESDAYELTTGTPVSVEAVAEVAPDAADLLEINKRVYASTSGSINEMVKNRAGVEVSWHTALEGENFSQLLEASTTVPGASLETQIQKVGLIAELADNGVDKTAAGEFVGLLVEKASAEDIVAKADKIGLKNSIDSWAEALSKQEEATSGSTNQQDWKGIRLLRAVVREAKKEAAE